MCVCFIRKPRCGKTGRKGAQCVAQCILDTSQVYKNNDEARGNLDIRRDGSREGEVVLRVGESAGATEGVLRHMHPLGDSARRRLRGGV